MRGARSKPKVAIISIRNTYQYGGTAAIVKTAYEFCNRYFDPTVFVLSFDPTIATSIKKLKFTSQSRTLVKDGISYVEIGARWSFWEPWHYQATITMWEEALSGYDYFFVVNATPIAAHPLALLNKKYLMWACTRYYDDRTERVKKMYGWRKFIDQLAQPFMQQIEEMALQKATTILTHSTYAKNAFDKALGSSKKNIIICPQPVELPQQHSSKKQHLVIAVGRFNDPRKNVIMLIKAFNLIRQKVPTARLAVIGHHPTQQQLEEVKELINTNAITFTGPVSDNELKNYYQQAHLALITSYQEGFGIVGLEALAHGTPVITTDCGGVTDFVLNGITGYVVAVNDCQAMAEKAVSLLQDVALWEPFSYQAKQLVESHFTHEKVFSTLQHAFIQTYPSLKEAFEEHTADGYPLHQNFLDLQQPF